MELFIKVTLDDGSPHLIGSLHIVKLTPRSNSVGCVLTMAQSAPVLIRDDWDTMLRLLGTEEPPAAVAPERKPTLKERLGHEATEHTERRDD